MLAMNILLCVNNYAKVALLFKFMNMGIVDSRTFGGVQDACCIDTIKEFWQEKWAEVIEHLCSKDHFVALGRSRHINFYLLYSR